MEEVLSKEKQQEVILKYLEYAYTGARMSDDKDTMERLARAISAFKEDDSEDYVDCRNCIHHLVDSDSHPCCDCVHLFEDRVSYYTPKNDNSRSTDATILTRDDIIGTSEWILHRDGSATCRHCHRTALNAWDYDNWLRYCPSCGKRMASAVSDKGDCE